MFFKTTEVLSLYHMVTAWNISFSYAWEVCEILCQEDSFTLLLLSFVISTDCTSSERHKNHRTLRIDKLILRNKLNCNSNRSLRWQHYLKQIFVCLQRTFANAWHMGTCTVYRPFRGFFCKGQLRQCTSSCHGCLWPLFPNIIKIHKHAFPQIRTSMSGALAVEPRELTFACYSFGSV